MEAEWIADRASLRWLVCHHPDWTQAELANAAAKLYNQGQPLATAEMQQVLERYGATQGYWA